MGFSPRSKSNLQRLHEGRDEVGTARGRHESQPLTATGRPSFIPGLGLGGQRHHQHRRNLLDLPGPSPVPGKRGSQPTPRPRKLRRLPANPPNRVRSDQVLLRHVQRLRQRGDSGPRRGQPSRGRRGPSPPRPAAAEARQAAARAAAASASGKFLRAVDGGLPLLQLTPPHPMPESVERGECVNVWPEVRGRLPRWPRRSTRPGAMSRRCATWSRVSHSARRTANCRRLRTRCSPDVRRHGSFRGSGGGAGAIAANSWRPIRACPARSSSAASASRRSTSSSTSSAA